MNGIKMYRAGIELFIDPQARRLSVYVGGQVSKTYPVGVGKPATPTPAGDYKVINKVTNPGGVLGSRWMGLNIPGGNYGIHGTNNPSSIGNLVSLGCIRMHNHHVEELFPQVPVGTPVRIAAVPGYNQKGGPVPAPAPGSCLPLDHRVHVVRPGDTLWKIAKEYHVSLEALLAANQLANPNILEVGQTIYIPG
ncbi:L,D-transpeptidase family protein [Desulforamulus putei]|uniref:LysM domain-containing protein n=1 Tax=Desulforamulus putei DSM 12395 TaxID=1121429 RepID=A0A1M4Z4M1_9FIRM|nr:L,D-transpeptidase family protein [Desulforamulus putei]SHF13033.1 LysM domain-containing protein [Desulforamulus putei DSM 12395]